MNPCPAGADRAKPRHGFALRFAYLLTSIGGGSSPRLKTTTTTNHDYIKNSSNTSCKKICFIVMSVLVNNVIQPMAIYSKSRATYLCETLLLILHLCKDVYDTYKLYRFHLFIFTLSPRGNNLKCGKVARGAENKNVASAEFLLYGVVGNVSWKRCYGQIVGTDVISSSSNLNNEHTVRSQSLVFLRLRSNKSD